MRVLAVLILCVATAAGCTRVVVNKNPGQRDRGIRYYRPKPYLFITPGEVGGKESGPTFATYQKKAVEATLKAAAANGVVRDRAQQAQYSVSDTELIATPGAEVKTGSLDDSKTEPGEKISISLVYMPDFAEEYSIRLMPGLGIGELQLELKDGWNLTTVGMKTDQQTDEIIQSTANLLSAAAPMSNNNLLEKKPPLPGSSGCMELLATNIPFGFYEAVIAEDNFGRKQLYGWRYIGFMPFQSCPVQACGMDQVGCHDPAVIYGMVIGKDGILRFESLARIPELASDCGMAATSSPQATDEAAFAEHPSGPRIPAGLRVPGVANRLRRFK